MRIRVLASVLLASFAVAACSSPQTVDPEPVAVPPPLETALVRFVHAMPDAPSINVHVGRALLGETDFRTWTEWTVVPAGEQEIVARHGEGTILDTVVEFQRDERYLIMAYGALTPVGDDVPAAFAVHADEGLPMDNPEQTWVRFANAVADSDRIGMAVTTGDTWSLAWPNQPPGTISEYKQGPVYDNTFELVPYNTSLPALHEFEYNLQVGIQYTFVATGRLLNGTMQVFAVTDHPSLRPE